MTQPQSSVPIATPNDPARRSVLAQVTPELLAQARGRLADRGIDPDQKLGKSEFGEDISVARPVHHPRRHRRHREGGPEPDPRGRAARAARGPAERDRRHAVPRLQPAVGRRGGARRQGLRQRVLRDGRRRARGVLSVVGSGGAATAAGFLAPSDDPKQNKKRLGGVRGRARRHRDGRAAARVPEHRRALRALGPSDRARLARADPRRGAARGVAPRADLALRLPPADRAARATRSSRCSALRRIPVARSSARTRSTARPSSAWSAARRRPLASCSARIASPSLDRARPAALLARPLLACR